MKKIRALISNNRNRTLIFIIVFAVGGAAALVLTHAATPAASIEAEAGVITAPASEVTNANASGGSYVRFNQPGSGGCGLATAIFCEDFEGPIANPKSRSGDFNAARLTGGRMVGATESQEHVNYVRHADIPAGCRSGSVTNPLPPADLLICDPVSSRNTHHALISATVQNYGDASVRVNQPFDFAGRTGTIRMDLSIDDEKALSGSPEFILSDIPNAVASIEDENGKGTGVSYGFIVQFRLDCSAGQNGPLVRIYNDYAESQLDDSRYGTNWCDSQNKVATAIGKMNRFEIKMSTNKLEIYGTDFSNDGVTFGAFKKIYSSVPINLPYSRAWLSVGVHNHASLKYYSKTTEFHYFDNIAFDGPAVPSPTVYQIPDNTQLIDNGMNLGWAFKNRSDPIMSPLTFTGVDKNGATSAKMVFDVYADGGLNDFSNRTVFYRLNGGAWRQYFVPPGVIANKAMIAHRSMYTVDISLADLVSGNNTVQFSADNIWYGYPAHVDNIDLLVWK